ncbi:cell cycle checkpoint protein RAD1-like isoform X2 [Antedon mediterranea]|uniref:cell cycle checkpoint protein RAD1-like isoform X2 n=1 Tax=Antedon mediterranea TaxID=105859 RepID=UPI003AF79A27
MTLSTQESDEDNQYVLIAKIDNAKNISNVLKAILCKDKELATVFATENGLKVTVEDSKCVQANAFLQATIFQSYIIREESATFKISLNVLQDCLTIFGGGSSQGSNPALKICYAGYGSPLLLMLEENGVLTDCSIKTLESDETLDFNFTSANVINKIIMKSECLKEAFQELDMTSEVLEILLSPDKPHFRLTTYGVSGSAFSDFPRESDLIESFQCTQTQSNSVPLMKRVLKMTENEDYFYVERYLHLARGH